MVRGRSAWYTCHNSPLVIKVNNCVVALATIAPKLRWLGMTGTDHVCKVDSTLVSLPKNRSPCS